MTHKDIIKHFGSAAKAAEKLGYTRQAIYLWKRGIPFRTQLAIQAATSGALRAKRPVQRRVSDQGE